MSLKHARHQKPGQSGRTSGGKGEPQLAVASDEASSAGHIQEGSGQVDLLQQVLLRGNLVKAWKHVKANKGSAGIDGLTIEQTTEYLKTHWYNSGRVAWRTVSASSCTPRRDSETGKWNTGIGYTYGGRSTDSTGYVTSFATID
jgi:hypothetical protein